MYKVFLALALVLLLFSFQFFKKPAPPAQTASPRAFTLTPSPTFMIIETPGGEAPVRSIERIDTGDGKIYFTLRGKIASTPTIVKEKINVTLLVEDMTVSLILDPKKTGVALPGDDDSSLRPAQAFIDNVKKDRVVSVLVLATEDDTSALESAYEGKWSFFTGLTISPVSIEIL